MKDIRVVVLADDRIVAADVELVVAALADQCFVTNRVAEEVVLPCTDDFDVEAMEKSGNIDQASLAEDFDPFRCGNRADVEIVAVVAVIDPESDCQALRPRGLPVADDDIGALPPTWVLFVIRTISSPTPPSSSLKARSGVKKRISPRPGS